ncbi:CRISPR-associated helicase/endonuclease Cas3 [[Clostridium] polysaccharolyticum]|uniref:CRISPR-associated helicase, Cas3 family n=1 Tax=[Clostridium] polysaccharolyticum TaxID=29364 RepID=A0A1I0G6H6_9FIRM|nr:CRISPR-associated helicase/endonuclease Cas3 [[Clostridium] polysaccharolyticum]SET66389.1 CRISPR-associated helicase, Cas3 family [[Clostridium] polysaccharolyticum]
MNLENYLAKPDKTIQQHNEELLECLSQITQLGYLQDEQIIRLVKESCLYHDCGKVNEEFQKRVHSKDKKIRFDPTKEVPHNVLSLYFLDEGKYQTEEFPIIQYAVGYHHNYGSVYGYLRKKQNLIKNLLESFPVYPGFRADRFIRDIDRIRQTPKAILVKGLLHKCDYCASGGVKAEFPNDFLENSLEELLHKWKENKPDADWNELQQFCKQHQKENIMVTAPTGMGKTEAALHWLGNGKGFFVLPLRTAINAMYDRIRIDLLNDKKISERLALLHSESAEYLINNSKMHIEEIQSYNLLGKQLSLPLTVSTMDQLFDFVFFYAGYELKLATFSYSKIIIDEIQMYNAELLAYLVFGLEQIEKIGGKIAIITATLMPFVRDKLAKNMKFSEQAFPSTLKRHSVKVIDEAINAKDILNTYAENKSKGKRNKILVICNTIKKAQQLYREIEESSSLVPEEELHMLHARYIRKERAELEREIKAFAGSKKELPPPANGIWISTSLVEASLDLDFDYLFTELQDLNSLFQRMGRCNRLGLKEIEEVNCFVYLKIEKTLFEKFIDEKIYNISKLELQKFASAKNESLMDEQEKANMLEQFTTKELEGSQYMKVYNETYSLLVRFSKNPDGEKQALRNIHTQEIIPWRIYNENSEHIKDLEEKLKDPDVSYEDRLKHTQELKQYVVSIPYCVYQNYRNSLSKGKSTNWGNIRVSNFEQIPIVGCIYTEKGFESLDDKTIEDPMFC